MWSVMLIFKVQGHKVLFPLLMKTLSPVNFMQLHCERQTQLCFQASYLSDDVVDPCCVKQNRIWLTRRTTVIFHLWQPVESESAQRWSEREQNCWYLSPIVQTCMGIKLQLKMWCLHEFKLTTASVSAKRGAPDSSQPPSSLQMMWYSVKAPFWI